MKGKKLKYQEYLSHYPDFDWEGFTEIRKNGYRWVHSPLKETNFLPLNLISDPPARLLDETDKLCLGYGLSIFDSFENSFKRYKALYNKFRSHQKEMFLEDKGDSIATLRLEEKDGIGNEPNKQGHFTFYEYHDVELEDNITDVLCIIDQDGNFVNI
ncbi:hypothetical protein [Bacteroides sp. 519]|uniref:hypothetical protein n=1 Tax=Bacteroides sp. 519 TaxID=2302937 RepID=UPI0013D1459C|nr:hypothetical protein [Bacteroides sp. 519]NDV58317.1 hypothetical protein [Bacteroides sp. 519]